MSAVMLNKLEGVHVGFLQQVTGTKVRRLGEKTWTKKGPDRLLQAAGNKQVQEYIDKRQATLAEWVSLWPIFEVYAKETGYGGGGGCARCGVSRTLQSNNWWPRLKIFRKQQGSGGDGNPAGVKRSREERRGGLLTTTGEGEAQSYRYDGTETDDARVGG